MNDLELRHDVAVELARKALALAEAKFAAGITGTLKEGTLDPATFVTEADKAAEALIVAGIRKWFPDDQIMGEEGAGHGAVFHGGYCWVLDPVDGTGNYAHGLRPWAVSVAVLRDGLPVVAAIGVEGNVYSTHLELSGVQKNAAWLTPRPARPPGEWIIAHELDLRKTPDAFGPLHRALIPRANSLRHLSSAVACSVFVADGRLDGFLHPKIALWDFAATSLVVEKAGCRFTRWDGKPPFPDIWEKTVADFPAYLHRVYRYDLLAAPPHVHEALLPLLQPYAGVMEGGV